MAERAALPSEVWRVRGGWERDPSHFPLPLSPSFASLYLPWQDAAFAAMFAEFGYLAGRVQTRLIDGYLYFRVVPVGGWTPPSWAVPFALRVWWLHPALARRVRHSSRRLREGHPDTVLQRWERTWRPLVERQLREAAETDLRALDDAALLRHFDAVCCRAGRNVRIHFLLHGAIAPAMARLEAVCRSIPALAAVRPADLMAGLSSESSAPGRALRSLAGYLRDRAALLARARELGTAAIARSPDALDPCFGALFRDWVARYGHRVVGRYEFIEPTLAERPERIVAQIRELASREGAGRGERATATREATVASARARLTPAERARFDGALAAAQRAYPTRDHNVVLTFNGSFASVRYALQEASRRWTGRLLERADDVFFLTADEVRRALADPAAAWADGLSLHAAARRRTWQRRLIAPPPPQYIGRAVPDPPLDGLPADAAFMTAAIASYLRGIQASRPDEGLPDLAAEPAVRGLGAVGGRYAGIARVIRGEDEFDRLEKGDVLVCPMTSPAWSVLFELAGALVTDHGGMLSHPAVVAREYGIPAVVATRDATKRIRDGVAVVVDGDAGTVTVTGGP